MRRRRGASVAAARVCRGLLPAAPPQQAAVQPHCPVEPTSPPRGEAGQGRATQPAAPGVTARHRLPWSCAPGAPAGLGPALWGPGRAAGPCGGCRPLQGPVVVRVRRPSVTLGRRCGGLAAQPGLAGDVVRYRFPWSCAPGAPSVTLGRRCGGLAARPGGAGASSVTDSSGRARPARPGVVIGRLPGGLAERSCLVAALSAWRRGRSRAPPLLRRWRSRPGSRAARPPGRRRRTRC